MGMSSGLNEIQIRLERWCHSTTMAALFFTRMLLTKVIRDKIFHNINDATGILVGKLSKHKFGFKEFVVPSTMGE